MDNKTLQNKTFWVILVTLATMGAEIFFGLLTNSMALTADGFHMGTHALALSVTFAVCLVITKYQSKENKLNALGGYTSAILLGLTGLGIVWESLSRLFHPRQISFDEALWVTAIGLLVNLICIGIMSDSHQHHHCHKDHHKHTENLNFKAAYLHILADIVTSVLAILALLSAKYFGLTFLDPLIGIFGGLIILKWSVDLIKNSFGTLIG